MREIQEMFNLFPNLNDPELTKSFMIKTNDNMVAIYLASLIRSITAMHDLINNKLEFRAAEGAKEDKSKEKEKDGDKEKAKDDSKGNLKNGDSHIEEKK
jgi:26S proteasome regulatory subunit N8